MQCHLALLASEDQRRKGKEAGKEGRGSRQDPGARHGLRKDWSRGGNEAESRDGASLSRFDAPFIAATISFSLSWTASDSLFWVR
jgi:hypothetical protein